jgi:NitT/TauT family transport system permease protein
VSALADRTRSMRRAAISLMLAATLYEGIARSGAFPAVLVPTLPTVARGLMEGVLDGSLPGHALSTLYRVLLGMGLAIVICLPLGILMGRYRSVEAFFLPLASALMPIPSLAWVPLFILWFGLGNGTAIGVVFYAAAFPMLLNAWSGVRAVNPLWLRAGSAMGANERALFWKVIVPGASSFIITGLRQAFLRAWIAVVGAEMLAASDWGLGWVIFDAKEFLRADLMLASLAVIGFIGFAYRAPRTARPSAARLDCKPARGRWRPAAACRRRGGAGRRWRTSRA